MYVTVFYTSAEWLNRQFSLIDTGGIDDVDAPFMEQIKHQADIAYFDWKLTLLSLSSPGKKA